MHITGEPDSAPVKVGVAITGSSIAPSPRTTTEMYDRSDDGIIRSRSDHGSVDFSLADWQRSLDRLLPL